MKTVWHLLRLALLLTSSASCLQAASSSSNPTMGSDTSKSSKEQEKDAPILANRHFEIKALEFEGLKTNRASSEVVALQKFWVGKRFDRASGQKIISAVFSTKEVAQVELLERQGTLVIRCQAKPRLAGLDLWVHEGVSENQVKQVFEEALKREGFVVGAQIDVNQVETTLKSVTQLCKNALNVQSIRTQHQLLPILDGEATLLKLSIWMGEPVTLNQIKALKASPYFTDLIQAELPQPNFWTRNPWIKPYLQSSPDLGSIHSLQDKLKKLYADKGRGDASFTAPVVLYSPTKEAMFVHYVVEQEGHEHRWGQCKITGDAPTLKLLENFKAPLWEGTPYQGAQLEKLRQELLELFKSMGFFQASVEVIVDPLDDDSHRIDVMLFCRAGPQSYLRKIEFDGNMVVHEPTLRRLLHSKSAALINERNLQRDLAMLNGLPCFESVQPELRAVQGMGGRFDLIFHLKDNAASDQYNFNFKTSDEKSNRPNLNFVLVKNNLCGRGRKLHISVQMVTASGASKEDQSCAPPLFEKVQNYLRRPDLNLIFDLEDPITLGSETAYKLHLQGPLLTSEVEGTGGKFSMQGVREGSLLVQRRLKPGSDAFASLAGDISKGFFSLKSNALNQQFFNYGLFSEVPGVYEKLMNGEACDPESVREYFRIICREKGQVAHMEYTSQSLTPLGFSYKSSHFSNYLSSQSKFRKGFKWESSLSFYSNHFQKQPLAWSEIFKTPWGYHGILSSHCSSYFVLNSLEGKPLKLFHQWYFQASAAMPLSKIRQGRAPYPWICRQLNPKQERLSSINVLLTDYRDPQPIFLERVQGVSEDFFIQPPQKDPLVQNFEVVGGFAGASLACLLPTELIIPEEIKQLISVKFWLFTSLFALLKEQTLPLLAEMVKSAPQGDEESAWRFLREHDDHFYQKRLEAQAISPIKSSVGIWIRVNVPFLGSFGLGEFNLRWVCDLRPLLRQFPWGHLPEGYVLGGVASPEAEEEPFSLYKHLHWSFTTNEGF